MAVKDLGKDAPIFQTSAVLSVVTAEKKKIESSPVRKLSPVRTTQVSGTFVYDGHEKVNKKEIKKMGQAASIKKLRERENASVLTGRDSFVGDEFDGAGVF